MKATTIQTYLFDKRHWNRTKAKAWLKRHRKVAGFIDENGYLHARQIDPDLFDRRSFRTIDLDLARGIKAVVGHLHASHQVRR
ncbi:MAG: hypothetical protein WC565_06065 [Parcubacteria group bacterium]|jgi:hypothetical protein